MIGASVSLRLRDAFSPEAITRCAFLVFACCAGLIASNREAWVAYLCLVPAGACSSIALSLLNVAMQLRTPRWVTGRAVSIYQTANFGGMTVGGWAWGEIAEAHGVANAVGASAIVMLCGAAIGLRFPLPSLGAVDLDSVSASVEQPSQLDESSSSRPIRIMVEYEIAERDVVAFLGLMAKQRRNRIRDSARDWTLLRDLGDRALWTECYQVSSWVEYLRLNERLTLADFELTERLVELHRKPQRPRIRLNVEWKKY